MAGGDLYQEVMAGYMAGARWQRQHPEAKRALLVGQAAPPLKPGTTHHPLFPFPRNCAGERLFRLSGWTFQQWFSHLDRVNTIEHFPGRSSSGKGDAFPLPLARECAAKLVVERRMFQRTVIFVGKVNAECYPWALPDPMELVAQPGGGSWAWLPHTSGIVGFWNDEANREKARALFSCVGATFFC